MALKKAVRLDVMIMTEAGLPDEEIIKWVKMAMLDWCDFEQAIVRIKEKHDRLIVEEDSAAETN